MAIEPFKIRFFFRSLEIKISSYYCQSDIRIECDDDVADLLGTKTRVKLVAYPFGNMQYPPELFPKRDLLHVKDIVFGFFHRVFQSFYVPI
jgi:hypothetical protein